MSRVVSDRWRNTIPGVNRWTTQIGWSNDGGHSWGGASLVEGSVTCDATSQVRWASQLTVADVRYPDGSPADPPVSRTAINPFTTRFKIRHGIAWSRYPNDNELLGLGVYKVITTNRAADTGGAVELTGNSFEIYLINARLPVSYQAPREAASRRLDRLIRGQLTEAVIVWRPGVLDRVMASMLFERDRWPLIDGDQASGSVAKSLGARCFCDGDGNFIVALEPALTDPVVWEARQGPGGVLINSTESLTDEYVYNCVVANGMSTDMDAPPPFPPQIVGDEDPASLTYWRRFPDQGGFGIKPFFYTSQMFTTARQAWLAASSRLASVLGLRQQITFDSLHDPTKEPGDVGLVTDPDGHSERVILDAVTYDLLGGPLQCTTRTTQTRLEGDIANAPDLDEGDAA